MIFYHFDSPVEQPVLQYGNKAFNFPREFKKSFTRPNLISVKFCGRRSAMDFNVFSKLSIHIENKIHRIQNLLECSETVLGYTRLVSKAVDSCISYNRGMKLLGLLYES